MAADIPRDLLGEWHEPGCGAVALTVRPDTVRSEGKGCRITAVSREDDITRIATTCGTDLYQPLDGGRFLARLDTNEPRAEIFARCKADPKLAGTITCSLGRGGVTAVETACTRTRQVAGRGVTEGYTFADGTTVSVFTTPAGRITWDGSAAEADPDRAGCVNSGPDWFCAKGG